MKFVDGSSELYRSNKTHNLECTEVQNALCSMLQSCAQIWRPCRSLRRLTYKLSMESQLQSYTGLGIKWRWATSITFHSPLPLGKCFIYAFWPRDALNEVKSKFSAAIIGDQYSAVQSLARIFNNRNQGYGLRIITEHSATGSICDGTCCASNTNASMFNEINFQTFTQVECRL